MASQTEEFIAICSEFGVPSTFQEFLKNNGVLNAIDFVLAAKSDKHQVDKEIIDPSGLQLSMTEKIAIRKAWWRSENLFLKKSSEAAQPAHMEKGISDEDARSLHDAFFRRHSFKLSSRRLLSDIQQGKLLVQFGTLPKTFVVILPESLHIRSAVGKQAMGTTLNVVPGQDIKAEEVYAELVCDSIELWRRIRALVNTLSFVSIQHPDWLPYQIGDDFCDKLLEWMQIKYNSRRPPLSYFIQAYVSTFSYFFEQSHMYDSKIADLMAAESNYRSFWTQFGGTGDNQPASARATHGASGHISHPDNSASMAAEMKRLKDANERLHAKVDKSVSEAELEKRRRQSENDRARNAASAKSKGDRRGSDHSWKGGKGRNRDRSPRRSDRR